MNRLSTTDTQKFSGGAMNWTNDPRLQKHIAEVLLWLLLLTLPFWFTAIGGYTALGTRVLVMALAAMSVNFLLGYTGVLSFGHAAYFGLGAYGVGLIIKYIIPSTLLGMAVGVLTALVAGAVIGLLIVHLRGIYFAMVTIAFGQVFYFIAYRWNNVTGGDDGLSGWSRLPVDFGFTQLDILHKERAFYYFVLFFFMISAAIMAWILRSPFGRTLVAIRENERRARFLGIPVDRHIWISWVISCGFCGLAGVLSGLLNNFASPHDLRWDQSGVFVIMAVLGGMRSFWGPLVGATIYVVLQDILSSHTANWMSFIGLFFVLTVLFCPRGILGLLRRKGKS
jgi:branched-chain amino acid transport system permease protein